MINIQKENLEWLHLTSPRKEDIAELKNKFNIHPIIIEELFNQSDRGKIEIYEDYIFIVYHMPIYDKETKSSRRGEIDFIVGKKNLITVSYETLEPIERLEQKIKKFPEDKLQSVTQLIHLIFKEFNLFALRELKHVEDKVNFVGSRIFKGADKKLLEEISYIKRDILSLSLIIASEKNIIESLIHDSSHFFGAESKVYFSDLSSDFMKVHYLLENLKATTESFSVTISQIFQLKTSEVVRKFSILGFLTFPLIFYTTVTLNPRIEPTFIYEPSDFWVWFGIITAVVIGLAVIFRKKGWL